MMVIRKRLRAVCIALDPIATAIKAHFLWAAILSLAVSTVTQGAPTNGVVGDATSSKAARDEAIRSIPWRQLNANDRRTAQYVVANAAIYRRLPTRVIDCDPEMFTFLIQHPEVVVDVWRVMGVSQVSLAKQPDGGFRGTDGAGTTGSVRYLFSNFGQDGRNIAVVYADGSYEGKPLLSSLNAKTLMLLQSSAVRETNGRIYITVRVDTFVHIEKVGLELVAKTVQPWISSTADQNFVETLSFVSNFSRTAEKNPQGMQRLAARLSTVDAPTRNELVQLCYRTADRYAQREPEKNSQATLLAGHEIAAVNALR